MFTPADVENLKLIYHLVKEKGMTLEGANMAMKRRGKSVQRDVSILERLQHIRAMLLEVRDSLGDNTPAEYEAPIEAMSELISDVEEQAQAEVVSGVTSKEEPSEVVEEPKEEVKEEVIVNSEPDPIIIDDGSVFIGDEQPTTKQPLVTATQTTVKQPTPQPVVQQRSSSVVDRLKNKSRR
jgi:hypothetical protein